mmetsp:Transcript_23222/g.48225  ORF Transcript_23222/g.48225 Transcript_23222/m.48225 type:complete len:136 (-) Transcript_23222:195-602(-)
MFTTHVVLKRATTGFPLSSSAGHFRRIYDAISKLHETGATPSSRAMSSSTTSDYDRIMSPKLPLRSGVSHFSSVSTPQPLLSWNEKYVTQQKVKSSLYRSVVEPTKNEDYDNDLLHRPSGKTMILHYEASYDVSG